VVETVLLDSVQSQANRMELALRAAYERSEIGFPLLAVNFSKDFPDIGEITTLEAPHRIADAIFRDSLLDGKPFRESAAGQRFGDARIDKATALLELCPAALIFGVWDSTGEQGGLGTKFQRAVVSEIVGYEATPGIGTSGRLDPLKIEKVEIFEAANPTEQWTLNPDQAAKDKSGKPKTKKPSEVNHGNIAPSVEKTNEGKIIPGGFTISHAVQTTVLSLVALRRLRFPLNDQRRAETDAAAHTLLAALALAAITYQRDDGYDLRSRCLLVPSNAPVFEMIPADGSAPTAFLLTTAEARRILEAASEEARKCGLPWSTEKLRLQPSKKLIQLIDKSRGARTLNAAD
jgi:CRISPR-associated protein Csb1